jgi:hypothetical protein
VGSVRRRDRGNPHCLSPVGGLRAGNPSGHAANVRGRLESSSQFGYSLFWGLIALALLALPFLVGFGIARLTGRGLKIAMGIAALFVIAIMVLGQLFIF